MDDSLRSLVASKNHKEILALEGDQYNPWKAVAAINLGKYQEALLFTEKRSFEAAYALYKLHRYRHSLRILRKLEGHPSEVLKAQCLYFLGYYADSYEILSKVSTSDEFAVNLAASEALDRVNARNRFSASLFSSSYKNTIQKTVKPKFSSNESRMEYEYNMLFKDIEDERLFIRNLQELYSKMPYEGGCADKQLRNLHRETIPEMGTRERETVEFNSGQRTSFTDPVHFQKNFTNDNKTEFKIFINYSLPGKEKEFRNINSGSEKMRLYKAYLSIKAGKKNHESTLKSLEKCPNSPLKEALLLLLSEENGHELQNKGIRAMEALQTLLTSKSDISLNK